MSLSDSCRDMVKPERRKRLGHPGGSGSAGGGSGGGLSGRGQGKELWLGVPGQERPASWPPGAQIPKSHRAVCACVHVWWWQVPLSEPGGHLAHAQDSRAPPVPGPGGRAQLPGSLGFPPCSPMPDQGAFPTRTSWSCTLFTLSTPPPKRPGPAAQGSLTCPEADRSSVPPCD